MIMFLNWNLRKAKKAEFQRKTKSAAALPGRRSKQYQEPVVFRKEKLK